MLTKEQILQADDLPREEVDVPEWGGTVFVRTMTGAERDDWEMETYSGEGTVNRANVRARLCARCMVDDQGARLFTDKEADKLGAKSGAALDRVFQIARELNGLSAKEVETLEKN